MLLQAGGTINIASGGAISGVQLASGVTFGLTPGEIDFGTVVSAGATLVVSSGAVATGDTVLSGGAIVVLSGGMADATRLGDSGGALLSYGSNGPVYAPGITGGTMTVSAGGVASGVSIASGGVETLLAGATDSAASVGSGGTLAVTSGAVAVNTRATGGSAIISAGGTEEVLASSQSAVTVPGSAFGVTLLSGANLMVSSGSAIGGFILGSGYTLDVFAGLNESSTSVGSGAALVVSSGAQTGFDHVLSGGTETVLAGGTAGGGYYGFDGGPDVAAGGALVVSSGGLVSGAVAEGSGLLLGAPGFGLITVSSGGRAIGDRVSGSQTVLSGGVDSATNVYGGGIETIQAGGTGINTQVGDNSLALVTSGGLEIVSAASSGYDNSTNVTIGSGGSAVVDANAYASGLFVLSGGSITVQAGGWASGTQVGSAVSGNFVVSSGGAVTIASGAWADNTNVWADGVQTVQTGGAVSNTVVFNRGTEMVQSGATETATLVASGGTDIVSAGATASGDFTFGGTISVGGTASGTMVSGGSETVLAGGSSVDDTATFGGSVTVSSGGVAFTPRIGSAGTLVLDAGAVVNGAISFVAGSGGIVGSNGILVISGTTMPTNIISGFDLRSVSQGDTIDLASVPFATGGTVSLGAGNVLSVTEGGATYTLNLDPNQNFVAQSFELTSDGHGGTAVLDDINALPCYAAGTRLATPAGDVAVEHLQAGDAVLALQDGAWTARTVRWVGRFTVDLARHPNPHRAAPIRIRAHAFAPTVPSRDLFLSPDHAVFVDGALMQAQALLNGASVTQEFPHRVTYLHVELDRHAVLLAEGLPAESFLDTGNRALFAGEAGTRTLHPDLASAQAWDERACAPLLLGGSRVTAVHRRLCERAETLGWVRSEEAGLVLTVDGQAVTPDAAGRLLVPAWLGLGPDRRRLGVAVTLLRFGGRVLPRAAFAAGWHAAERGLRWTDGDARLILPQSDRPTTLRIAFGMPGAFYWQTEAAPARARAV